MPLEVKKKNLIELRKLKKDGSLDSKTMGTIITFLKNGKIVILPVDSIYGVIGVCSRNVAERIGIITNVLEEHLVCLISSFRMLDQIAEIDKFEFDFLHRIWPGEVIVYLHKKGTRNGAVPVRMPRSKYILDIISMVGMPLYYTILSDSRHWHIYSKNSIIQSYRNQVDLTTIIDEFCKEHNEPSIVDISSGTIDMIQEGRVSSEEIKSLYFLGKDDVNI